MPEGDNIHAHARQLSATLIDQPLAAVWSHAVDRRALIGERVTSVEAIGKHLLITFSGGAAMRVHLGMGGSWRQLATPIDRELLARASLALVTRDHGWLCRNARAVEWSRARLARSSPAIARLGPDLIARPELDAILARARRPEHAARAIGEVLLDQSIASGIGNVYKCELLFLHALDPWRRLDAIDDPTLRAIYADAARLLAANVGRARTTTGTIRRGRSRVWVYDRARRACYKCGSAIEVRRQLPSLRPTWYCPRCQRSSGAA